MIKAVIFDMDGVISDTEDCHRFATDKALFAYGVDVKKVDLSSYTGKSSRFVLSDIIKRNNIDTTFEEFLQLKTKFFFEGLEQYLKPIPGVIELIKKIKAANFKLAVGSSSDRVVIEFVLKRFKVYDLFQAISSGDEVTNCKPDPEIFLKAALKIGENPLNCLVIEDSTAGVTAAKAASMKCIGFKSPNTINQDLSMADVIIDKFEDFDIEKIFCEIVR